MRKRRCPPSNAVQSESSPRSSYRSLCRPGTAINNAGTIAGIGSTSNQYRGFVHAGGAFAGTAPLSNGDRSSLSAINNSGRLVGSSTSGSVTSPTGNRSPLNDTPVKA